MCIVDDGGYNNVRVIVVAIPVAYTVFVFGVAFGVVSGVPGVIGVVFDLVIVDDKVTKRTRRARVLAAHVVVGCLVGRHRGLKKLILTKQRKK